MSDTAVLETPAQEKTTNLPDLIRGALGAGCVAFDRVKTTPNFTYNITRAVGEDETPGDATAKNYADEIQTALNALEIPGQNVTWKLVEARYDTESNSSFVRIKCAGYVAPERLKAEAVEGAEVAPKVKKEKVAKAPKAKKTKGAPAEVAPELEPEIDSAETGFSVEGEL